MNNPNLHYYYDTEADVLYFSKGEPTEDAISREVGDDVVARVNPKTGETVGFTVLNFMKRAKEKTKSVSLPFQLELTPVA